MKCNINGVWALEVNFKTGIFATGGITGFISIWRVVGFDKIKKLKGHFTPVTCLGHHPKDDNVLVSCEEVGFINVWDIE